MAMFLHRRRGQDKGAFLSSCAYLIFMLVGAAAAVYPNLLLSTTDPALNITIYNAAAGSYSLSVGLIWWSFGIALATGYFVFVYRMFRGKVTA
jgi:cytochrome d ubiquinol oxidase subunit II